MQKIFECELSITVTSLPDNRTHRRGSGVPRAQPADASAGRFSAGSRTHTGHTATDRYPGKKVGKMACMTTK
jgi:hypothetical protein